MPKQTWNEAILETIDKLGGQNVLLQDIYTEMSKGLLMTPHHLQPWKVGGQARYECWIRRYLTTLERKGAIIRVSDGIYSLVR